MSHNRHTGSMSTIDWNCQCLGSSQTIRHLKDLNGRYLLKIIFLMEIKNGDTLCEGIQYQVGMDNAFYVTHRGSSEGLALCWREETSIQILYVSAHRIDTTLTFKQIESSMYMMWIHVDIDENQRKRNWEELGLIARGWAGMWVSQRGFNAITHH